MRLINAFALTFLLFTMWWGESLTIVTPLEDSLSETSGLLYLEDRLISINDSEEAAIHEVDSTTGKIVRTVIVNNACNFDWEDIAADEEYLYIGDVGNNFGKRTDLKIYRIAIADYLNSDDVMAEVITFSYSDQQDFEAGLFSTNFDAEAFVAANDKLYVFTKNWGDHKTGVYEIPKEPGSYQVERKATINTNGLITGATYDEDRDRVILSGNSLPFPFLMELKNFSLGDFSDENLNRYKVRPPAGYSVQVEGVVFLQGNTFYLSAEKNMLGKSALFELDLPEA